MSRDIDAADQDEALRSAATNCIHCLSEIQSGAQVCPVCKLYQRPWRNALPYLGGVAALIALLASSATFTFSKILEINRNISWSDKASIAYAQYPGAITLVNSG